MDNTTMRISRMEALYDKASFLVNDLELALERFLSADETFRTLSEYLDDGWREDYEADERGELPSGLKRGVLSQDGLYDLLEKEKELKKKLGL